MGNLSMYSSVAAGSAVQARVQSSLASDMEAQLNALLDAALLAGRSFTDLNLSGAGDGHSFMATLVTSAEGGTGANNLSVFAASSHEALQAQVAAALAALAPGRYVYGWAEAGSCDGHRWMGILLDGAD